MKELSEWALEEYREIFLESTDYRGLHVIADRVC